VLRSQLWNGDKSKKKHLLACDGAHIVMHAETAYPAGLRDHFLQPCARCFNEMGPYTFEQIPSLVSRKGYGEMLLGSSQNALQPHNDEIGKQVDPHRFWPPTHEFLHETRDALAESGLDFTLRF